MLHVHEKRLGAKVRQGAAGAPARQCTSHAVVQHVLWDGLELDIFPATTLMGYALVAIKMVVMKHGVCFVSPKEKALISCDIRAYLLVRLAGIEPTTPWFVVNTNIVRKYFAISGRPKKSFLINKL